MKYPCKSRLLRLFESGPLWDYEAIDTLVSDEGRNDAYFRWTARFWLMEMAGGGVLDIIEEGIDDGSHFGNGKLLSKYQLTDYGRMRIQDLLE